MSFPLHVSNARAATVAFVLAAVLGAAGAAGAQGIPGADENKCLAGKNKCVVKKLAGLMKCRAACEKKPDKCGQAQTDCEAKVIEKFDGGADPTKGCFAKLEAKADPATPASVCTTIGDTATVEAQVDATVGDLVATLERAVPAAWTCDPAFYNEGGNVCDCGCGAPDLDCAGATVVGACVYCDSVGSCALNCSQIDPANNSRCRPYQCGNGAIESPESCDGTDLGGATCVSLLGFGSGTLACTAGCGYDVSGCSSCPAGVRFLDTGLTVLDCDTGLEWEKKTAGNVNALYTWSAGGTAPDGTAFTTFLPAVAAALGGTVCASPYDCTSSDGVTVSCTTPPPHGCWRLPEIDELKTIVDCGGGAPCIHSIFGPTTSSDYWSSTSRSLNSRAWIVYFGNGDAAGDPKIDGFNVRAVRSGS